ncbi:hypothetical protein [Kribbella pratensis]|uniref:hypothetical protein n=1 Tax=Kribbella pratensis TaxID=2512112 RepID=UPI001416F571|nr:hypothetical protein [Kribbella pratensis]
MAGHDRDGRVYAGDCAEAVAGVGRDLVQLLAVGAQPGAYGGLEAGRLGVAAGRQASVGEHQRDQLRRTHQNIAYN